MKTIHTFSVGIIFIMLSLNVTAQNGGMIIKDLSATNAILVGNTASEMIDLSNGALVLPPLTDSDIQFIPNKRKGMIVFSSSADELQYYNGSSWQSIGIGNVTLPCEGYYLDQDGNTFSGVEIGTQCWMGENLKVTHFPNGGSIPLIESDTQWGDLPDTNSDVAYCYYENNTNSDYGAMYTYAAAIADNWVRDNDDVTNGEGGQGICPDGWHLPTNAEWMILENFISYDGHSGAEGTALKSVAGWYINGNGTDDYDFTALPGGYRSDSDGTVGSAGYSGSWWSATEYSSYGAWILYMSYGYFYVKHSHYNKSYGFSVRCLRDY